jgi:hypothetical protein
MFALLSAARAQAPVQTPSQATAQAPAQAPDDDSYTLRLRAAAGDALAQFALERTTIIAASVFPKTTVRLCSGIASPRTMASLLLRLNWAA